MKPDRLEQFLSWARYLYWSDILYQRWTSKARDQDDVDSSTAEWRSFALAAQWLASVPVLIEGWRKLQMPDSLINRLLDAYPDYCDLLRRFRNGVYHFQPEIFDARLRAFPTSGQETLLWVSALFYEFKRFLWEWPDKYSGTDAEKDELRSVIHRAVGWLPVDILHAMAHDVQRLQREAESRLAEAGDYSSEEARELLAAIGEAERDMASLDKSPILNVLTRLTPR